MLSTSSALVHADLRSVCVVLRKSNAFATYRSSISACRARHDCVDAASTSTVLALRFDLACRMHRRLARHRSRDVRDAATCSRSHAAADRRDCRRRVDESAHRVRGYRVRSRMSSRRRDQGDASSDSVAGRGDRVGHPVQPDVAAARSARALTADEARPVSAGPRVQPRADSNCRYRLERAAS